MLFTIVFFFIMTWGYGFALAKLVKEADNFIERNITRIALGLGLFPILSVTLNLIKVPLVWWVFLVLSLVVPFYFIVLKKEFSKLSNFSLNLSRSNIYVVLAIFLAIILFGVYLKGAFTYPYLEDDDPWEHATGTTYVAEHKTYSRYINQEITEENFFRNFLEPYPPAYDTLMGVLYQTNNSVVWTLKFFNVLMIALGTIFFYLFALQFSQSRKKALCATFVITILPCFMSHFIWAQTLGLVLIFPAFYCFEKIKENSRWAILGAVISASIFISQPSTATFYVIMFGLYLIAKVFVSYNNKEGVFIKQNSIMIIGFISGILLSMIYWIPTLIKYGLKFTLKGIGIDVGLFSAENVDTSGGIIYGIKDYIVAPLVSKMDQPTGLGIFVFLLVLFSVSLLIFNYKKIKTNPYYLTILFWLIFTFIGTEGNALPYKLFPHRFWAFFAIPITFLTTEGLITLSRLLKNPAFKYSLLSVIFVGLLWTSAYPKYVVETSMWPPGAAWSSGEELEGYMALQEILPKNTSIFNICSHEGKLLAFGMYTPPYDPDLYSFKRQIENKTLDDIYSVAKKENFKYIVVDGYCIRKMNINQTNQLLQQMVNSTKFKPTYSTQAFWLFKVL